MSELKLEQAGFKGGLCPVTNVVSPNISLNFYRYHLSYNSSSRDYGSDTTAIVLEGRVFFLLNGDHAVELQSKAQSGGIDACIDYFIANLHLANKFSEHKLAVGIGEDILGLVPTAEAVIGLSNVKRIFDAVNVAPNLVVC